MTAPISSGRYRSLFEDLPPLVVADDVLHELGRPGGPCDLGADVRADSHVAAVWPFFGQFLAHDITADRSPLVHRAARAELRNARAPALGWSERRPAKPRGDRARTGTLRSATATRSTRTSAPARCSRISWASGPSRLSTRSTGRCRSTESFRSLDPGWTPTLPARRAGAFGLADILVPA